MVETQGKDFPVHVVK